MVIEVCGLTDIGKHRELNEDSFRLGGFLDGKPLGVCVLADGMGGHNAGEIASSMAADIVTNELLEALDESDDSKITLNMAEAIDFANSSVFERSLRSREQSGMGTTLVVAYVKDSLVRIANIGDSCAYVVSKTQIQKITVDHSVVEELVQRGSITRQEARNHPDKNIITRALGTEEFVDADFYDYNLSEGETVILCSDGLTETVTDERIKEIINENEDVNTVAESLVAEANKNGGVDNITVVVIRAQKEERV
ncbi:MAG: Stp1/IreP family PP2C-type Ser/Thr phosphatase [Clostridia bacterium]|nr:Stp1/IreP family PP2C-type Ser/Thr phosphatase [Clostridia bacterium]